jgi:hypothetical protein
MDEDMTKQENSALDSIPILVAALLVSIVLIAFTAWYWILFDMLFFFMPFLTIIVCAVFFCVIVWSVVHICRRKRFRKIKAYIPFIIQMTSLIIVLTVPFTSIMLDLDFRLHLKQREKVVSKVISGDLKPNVSHNPSLIHLPSWYGHLSKGGGDIMVERNGNETYVFFFFFRGILDNFSGFMYRSDDTPPQNGDFGGEFIEIERLKKNWYWVAAN